MTDRPASPPVSAVSIDEIVAFARTLEMDQPPVHLDEVAQDWVQGRLITSEINTRPGGYVPGPTLMGAADWVAWLLVFTRIGITPMALTWDLKINFLRPAHGSDVIVQARQTKFGKLSHATIEFFMETDLTKMVAHATTTYVVPPPSTD